MSSSFWNAGSYKDGSSIVIDGYGQHIDKVLMDKTLVKHFISGEMTKKVIIHKDNVMNFFRKDPNSNIVLRPSNNHQDKNLTKLSICESEGITNIWKIGLNTYRILMVTRL